MLYPLKGGAGSIETFGEGQAPINFTYGGFTLPVRNGKLLMARRDDKPTIPYPGWWNCLGGGASPEETSPTEVVGREFQEESLCNLGRIVGRVGRPLRAVLGRPKKVGDPISVDTAEAFLVAFTGEPSLTDESREIGWFDYAALRAEQKIVGRDVTPFGRTMMFALWGVSLAADPIYVGDRHSEALTRLGIRGVETSDIVLSKCERYLVSLELGDLVIWHNLSLAREANDRGILPGGCLESWLGR
jgi:ADP-ribose pyrophosphatase YjhB (NUDIX family)